MAKADVLAEFDPLEQLHQARDSAAKYDDLAHQVRQRQADNAANAEERELERDQAEAELAKARLDVIGIMNIVLATVLERTREIGIRRSVGARRLDIARQFVSEAVLISAGGGLIGIAFGFCSPGRSPGPPGGRRS